MRKPSPPTETLHDNLEKSRDELKKMAAAMDAILAGEKTQAQAAKGLGITKYAMGRYIKQAFSYYIGTVVLSVRDLAARIDAVQSPSDRLVMDLIYGAGRKDEGPPADRLVILPEYDDRLLWRLVRTYCPHNQYEVLSRMYGKDTGCPANVAELAGEMGITRQCLYQTRNHAFDNLRRPAVMLRLFPALSRHAEYAEIAGVTADKLADWPSCADRRRMAGLRHEPDIRVGIPLGVVSELRRRLSEGDTASALALLDERFPDRDVESSALSGRAKSRLRENGVHTFSQLAGIKPEDIFRWKHMKQEIVQDIADGLTAYLNEIRSRNP